MNNEELIKKAIENRKKAFIPISKYAVGACLLMKSGKIYDGVNIEDKSGVGISICAERTAFIKAISDGCFDFDTIAVVGGFNDELTLTMPCGVCRQFMINLAPHLKVIVFDGNKIKEYKIEELLPDSFKLI